jgi:hypothetical protein
VGFVVDKVALGQVFFSEYFGFPCQSSFHQFFSIITFTYHPGLVQYSSSGRSTQSPTAQIKNKIKKTWMEDRTEQESRNWEIDFG